MTLPRLEAVEVVRRGRALQITIDQSERTVRLVDLELALGIASAESRCIESAKIVSDRIELSFERGSREAIGIGDVEDPAKRARRTKCADLVVINAGLLMTADGTPEDALGMHRDAAVVAGGGEVLWVGAAKDVEQCGYDLSTATRLEAHGRLVTPGLVDCHAHPMFAGNRADEYARRARGESYLEISAAGGGIGATLEPTRSASFDEHVRQTASRMSRALAGGTTTCEAKSGYDLTVDGELRLLEVALAVDAIHQVDLSPTLLGAHLVPPEYSDQREDYVRAVAEQMIPRAAAGRLATAVDVYCDEGAFTLAETRTILEAAREAKLHLRAHVGQFADLGGPELISELGGLSADHLEQVSERGLRAMATHGVVAVMLPGACVQLRQTPPAVAAIRDAGVAMALATDMNPGTTMCETLPMMMWLATTHFGMTVEEAWLGVTAHAARALGRHNIGLLTERAACDLIVWNAEIPAEIPYRYGADLVAEVVKHGRLVPRL